MYKNDCEIIEDLLLSYSDDVLNEKTKSMVEEHLKECNKCRKKLESIQNEDVKECKKQETEINYLKKLRRKTIIKSILIAILIVFIIFGSHYLYKLNIINNMGKVYKEYQNSDYYIESISGQENKGEEYVSYSKEWKKGNKKKEETGIVKEDGTYEASFITYSTIGERKKIRVDVKENKAYIYNDYFKELNNVPFNNKYQSISNNLLAKLADVFYFKVRKDTSEIGKWYYVLEYGENSELWIDKDTFEPIREEGFSYSVEYYNNTKLIKKRNIPVSQVIKLEKNNVKDEEVDVDLSKYKVVQEADKNIEDLL